LAIVTNAGRDTMDAEGIGNPSCRESRMSGCTCGEWSSYVSTLLCVRGCGCSWHPAFSAPSDIQGAKRPHHSGKSCRGNEDACREAGWRESTSFSVSWPALCRPSRSGTQCLS